MTDTDLVLQHLQQMNSRLERLELEVKQHRHSTDESIKVLQATVEDGQGQLLGLHAELSGLRAEVIEVSSNLGDVKSDLGHLGAQLGRVGSQVELLQDLVQLLNERVEDLETDRRSARRVADLGGALPYRGPALAPMGAGFTEREAQYQRPSPYAQ